MVSPVRFQNRVTPLSADCAVAIQTADVHGAAVPRSANQQAAALNTLRLCGYVRDAMPITFVRLCSLLALCSPLLARPCHAGDDAGYPTAARAEYVFACMATNGGNQEALQRCSCAIDVIATLLPHKTYQEAETVLRMRQSAGGYLGQEFRSAAANEIVRDLDEAQAEAEVRCF